MVILHTEEPDIWVEVEMGMREDGGTRDDGMMRRTMKGKKKTQKRNIFVWREC